MSRLGVDAPRSRATAPAGRLPARGRLWGGVTLVTLLIAWSLHRTDVGIAGLVQGREGGTRLIRGLLRPDLSTEFLGIVGTAALETVHISLAALVFAVLLGLPLAVLQAGNVGVHRLVRRTANLVAAALRGIPELLWALVFVATVGLGPAAGTYAIGLHGAGLLAKLCSEQLEGVAPGPVEALRLSGAPRPVVAAFAILPQARAGLASLVLYQWECNVRTATVVGFVGAGGIGQALDISLKLFRYGELSTLVLTVLVLIIGVDGLSRSVRRRLGAAV